MSSDKTAFTERFSAINNHSSSLWSGDIILKRNEILHSAGKTDTNVYYVSEGALHIYHETESDLHTIRFGYKNSLFLSLDSFLTGNPSVYSVQAIKHTVLKVITKQAFTEFINSERKNLELWSRVQSATIASLLEREIDILSSSPKERYNRVLERSPQLFQEIPHKYIAAYLRMAPETLSRLQKS